MSKPLGSHGEAAQPIVRIRAGEAFDEWLRAYEEQGIAEEYKPATPRLDPKKLRFCDTNETEIEMPKTQQPVVRKHSTGTYIAVTVMTVVITFLALEGARVIAIGVYEAGRAATVSLEARP